MRPERESFEIFMIFMNLDKILPTSCPELATKHGSVGTLPKTILKIIDNYQNDLLFVDRRDTNENRFRECLRRFENGEQDVEFESIRGTRVMMNYISKRLWFEDFRDTENLYELFHRYVRMQVFKCQPSKRRHDWLDYYTSHSQICNTINYTGHVNRNYYYMKLIGSPELDEYMYHLDSEMSITFCRAPFGELIGDWKFSAIITMNYLEHDNTQSAISRLFNLCYKLKIQITFICDPIFYIEHKYQLYEPWKIIIDKQPRYKFEKKKILLDHS